MLFDFKTEYDDSITRPEESNRVSVCVWSRNPEKGGQRSILDYKLLWMNEWMMIVAWYCIACDVAVWWPCIRILEISNV
jgi:hypothetical protein